MPTTAAAEIQQALAWTQTQARVVDRQHAWPPDATNAAVAAGIARPANMDS
jgi:hypothetical protein